MTDTKISNPNGNRVPPPNFGTWMLMTFVGHSIGAGIFTIVAAFFRGIPIRVLLVPYIALACCGAIFGPLLYWARLARNRPKSCAVRFTVAMFLYSQAVMMALGFGMSKVRILSFGAFANDYAPFIAVFFALCSVPGYVVARRKLEASR